MERLPRTSLLLSTAALLSALSAILGLRTASGAEGPPVPRFEAQDIDTTVEIGYGLATGDVDGDRKLDILLADKREIVWYRNPDWKRFVIARDLTPEDNVAIAARDLDGDGKVEVAAGAGWNPGNTVDSGSVHYLIAPADRTQLWEVIDLPREPTVHRMRWITDAAGGFHLVVAPLHGRGNRRASGRPGYEGAGVRVLAYRVPSDPKDEWKTELVDESLHMTHNLDPVEWDRDPGLEILLAGQEGVVLLDREDGGWKRTRLAGNEDGEHAFRGASEVRAGRLPGGKRFLATIEPFHGNELVAYTPPAEAAGQLWVRRVVDGGLAGGHAVACADLRGSGSDQIVAGWREKDGDGKVGVRLYIPLDASGTKWNRAPIDDGGMACEDLKVADLDGDGRLDVIAAGRATRNLKVYWNRKPAE